jgi:hypothetical protein
MPSIRLRSRQNYNHITTFLNRGDDIGKIIIQQAHIGGFFGDTRLADAHHNADVRQFQRQSVVHAITSNRNDMLILLKGTDSGKSNVFCIQRQAQLSFRQLTQLIAGNRRRMFRLNLADLPANSQWGMRMIAGHQNSFTS